MFSDTDLLNIAIVYILLVRLSIYWTFLLSRSVDQLHIIKEKSPTITFSIFDSLLLILSFLAIQL